MHRDWSPLCVCAVEPHSHLGVVPVAGGPGAGQEYALVKLRV